MNETKTAMIAKSKLKRNPTFCNIDGGLVDRNKQIDPNPADNTKTLLLLLFHEKWRNRSELLVYSN
jgi:hypothetical protein